MFDECFAELSPKAQQEISDYIDWICEFVLTDNAGVKSAKELVIVTERIKYNRKFLEEKRLGL